MNIFDMHHVFVTFAPGAGGNFISGLLDKINSGSFSELYVSSSGSSHVVNNGKINGGDSISFGSSPEENVIFSNIADREKYYLDRILIEYSNPRKVITWTHDFTNLPLYKKHFKNSRSLVISTFDTQEKFVSILMHVTKVILTDESDIPIPKDLWLRLKQRLKSHILMRLERVLEKPIDIDHIFDNRCKEYSDLIFYLSTFALLKYAGLYDVLKLINEPIEPAVSNPNFNIRELVNSADVILPYRYLIENNVDLLQDTIAKLFCRQLSQQEIMFIHSTFQTYRSKQNIEILTDPLLYFNKRKAKAIETVKKIKAGTI